jgi:4-hydroxybutyrate dehydrogenase
MTLINYLTRVHFGDGVLIEAVRAEMESRRKFRPLIVADRKDLESGAADRLFLSFPSRLKTETFSDIALVADDKLVAKLADFYVSRECDLIVAFGRREIIELAKLARIAISKGKKLAAAQTLCPPLLPDANDDQFPDLFIIPAIDGIPSAFSMRAIINTAWSGRTVLTRRSFIPSLIILDPTLYIDGQRVQSTCALAEDIACCAEAFLAPEFNPPADGIALDGLIRAFSILDKASKRDDLAIRREIVAVGLNAGLALQKGSGMTQAMSSAIKAVSGRPLHDGSLCRILLPGSIQLNHNQAANKHRRLIKLLGTAPEQRFGDLLSVSFARLPLPSTLSEMSIETSHIHQAAPVAATDLSAGVNARYASKADLLKVMQDAY